MEPEWAKEEDSAQDMTCSVEQSTADPLSELSPDVEMTCEAEQDDDLVTPDIGAGHDGASGEVGDEFAEELAQKKAQG